MYTDQQKEDNKTIYPTPVFEEVLPRLGSQNVAGEPPATPGENRSSVGKDIEDEEVTTIERNRDNGKPWTSRIALGLKSPDVLPSRFHLRKAFAD